MKIFEFLKNAGASVFGAAIPDRAAASKQLNEHLARSGVVTGTGVHAEYQEDGSVKVLGTVGSQAEKEKILLAIGNVKGVEKVLDGIQVKRSAAPAASAPAPAATPAAAGGPKIVEIEPEEPESRFYTVKSGDTLGKIAKEHYGNASEYPKIFEANKPLLSDPDKIYPGQVLRIPA